MAKQVIPTKGNLIATKKSLDLARLGYDLFASLPDKVGRETADTIEAEDPHKSSWNWNL